MFFWIVLLIFLYEIYDFIFDLKKGKARGNEFGGYFQMAFALAIFSGVIFFLVDYVLFIFADFTLFFDGKYVPGWFFCIMDKLVYFVDFLVQRTNDYRVYLGGDV